VSLNGLATLVERRFKMSAAVAAFASTALSMRDVRA
jgi:hypothetical protein